MPASRPELEALAAKAQSTFGLLAEVDRLDGWVREVTAAPVTKLDAGVVLACELFHRTPAALTCFEERVVPRVKAALTKLGAPPPAVDEHVQAMRTRLLADEQGARLKHYRGVGSFEAFVIKLQQKFNNEVDMYGDIKQAGDCQLKVLEFGTPIPFEILLDEDSMKRIRSMHRVNTDIPGALELVHPNKFLASKSIFTLIFHRFATG